MLTTVRRYKYYYFPPLFEGYHMTDIVVYEASLCNVKWGAFVLIGFLMLIFGLLMALFPGITATVVVMLFGVIILILAFLAVILALLHPAGSSPGTFLLIGGIIAFLVGVAAILSPIFFGEVLVIIIAIVLFIIGLMDIVFAIAEKSAQHRLMIGFLGVLSIIFALLLMGLPLLGGIIIFGYLIAIYFIIYGVISIIAGYAIRGLLKESCAS